MISAKYTGEVARLETLTEIVAVIFRQNFFLIKALV